MRTIFILTLSACSLLPMGGLRAQAPSSSPSPAPTPSATTPLAPLTDSGPVGKGFGKGFGQHKGMFQNLAPEDRQKLLQARQAAMSDPAVQAAQADGDQRAMHKAVREAMLRNDPTLAPLLAKIRAKAGFQNSPGQTAQPIQRPAAQTARRGGGMGQQLAFLPEDERTKLRSAYAAANNDPQLAGLRQQMTAATTPEAKAQASKAYRAGVRNAMLRNDPSIAPILQKVRDHRNPDIGIVEAATL